MRSLILPLIACLAAATPAVAGPGATGGSTLRRPVGARGIAMADAFAGVSQAGLDALSYNPAGLAGLTRKEIKSVYNRGIIDDHFAFLGYAHPRKKAVVTAGLVYYDAGTITLNLSSGLREKRKAQQDMVGVVGAALEWGDFNVGALAKYYRFELAEAAKASGAALDAGAQWRTPLKGLSLGAATQNAGPSLKFEQESDPLPLAFRAGVAYLLNLRSAPAFSAASGTFDQFLFTADAIKIRDERLVASTGLEMRMPFGDDGAAALRAGYMFNSDIDALSMGVGFQEGRFRLDYGIGVKKQISSSHHFSFGVTF